MTAEQQTDAEWILKNGPQRLRPSSTGGMVHDDAGLYVRFADFRAAVDRLQATQSNIHDASAALIDGMRKTIEGAKP